MNESELKMDRHNRPIQKSELDIDQLYRPIQLEDRIGLGRLTSPDLSPTSASSVRRRLIPQYLGKDRQKMFLYLRRNSPRRLFSFNNLLE